MLCQDKWPRQKLEDGDLATKQWAPDRTDTDAVDPNSLTKTPKPPKDFKPEVGTNAGRGKGKSSASNPQKPDEGDEGCQIIEVFDILPISYTGGQVVESSRGTKHASDAPAKTKKKPLAKKLKQTELSILRPKVRQSVVA